MPGAATWLKELTYHPLFKVDSKKQDCRKSGTKLQPFSAHASAKALTADSFFCYRLDAGAGVGDCSPKYIEPKK